MPNASPGRGVAEAEKFSVTVEDTVTFMLARTEPPCRARSVRVPPVIDSPA